MNEAALRFGGNDVRRMLDEAGVQPSKHRGQNFLCDPNVAERIVRLAAIERGDRVVEVGVGVGSLTSVLLGAGAHVLGIEIDDRLAAVAGRYLRTRSLDLRVCDATTFDWSTLPHDRPSDDRTPGDRPWKFVANLPYATGTHILIDALDNAPQVHSFVIMVQREVGERIVAEPGSRTYGGVSVKVAFHAEARLCGKVSPSVFYPRPEVDSVLVSLVRRHEPLAVDRGVLYDCIEAGFGQRRKTIRSSLSSRFARADVEDALAAAGVDLQRRAETLSLRDFVAISNSLDTGSSTR